MTAAHNRARPDDRLDQVRASFDNRAIAQHDIRSDSCASTYFGATSDPHGRDHDGGRIDIGSRIDANQWAGRRWQEPGLAEQREIAFKVPLRRRMFGEVSGLFDGDHALAGLERRQVSGFDHVGFSLHRKAIQNG